MPSLPSIFDQCKPRPEVLAGELPDAIFAADLWEVFCQRAHPDYQDAVRFFAGTHPTENLKLLIKDVAERLAGVQGGTLIFRLETGFGGGKSHALIAAVHVARECERLSEQLSDYGINRFPRHDVARVAAFVGEESDPLGAGT
jgi:predicted AAA+ superfamily ATPase